MVTGEVEVSRDGKPLARMYPARWFWTGREGEPTTEVALRRGVGEDLYLVLGGYDAGEQSATFQVHVNPLVNWIWFGVGILVIGTFIAYLPERALAYAVSRVPDASVTTALLLVLGLLLPATVGVRAGEWRRFRARLWNGNLRTRSCARAAADCRWGPAACPTAGTRRLSWRNCARTSATASPAT